MGHCPAYFCPRFIAFWMVVGALLPGAVTRALSQQVNDSSFDATVGHPAYTQTHPRVLVDAGHQNVFTTTTNRLEPFIQVLRNDGYDVRMGREPFSQVALDPFALVVIATAQGSSTNTRFESAFTDEEIAALKTWILQGGSLLLATDHAPFDAAAAKLISALGGVGGEGYVRDTQNFYTASDVPPESLPGWLVFSRENGLLGEHPILRGRDSSETIAKVVTFGGSSVTAPKNGKALLTLSPTATNNARAGTPPRRLGTQQGAAFVLGKGRVVVLGDATMLTAQHVQTGGFSFQLGMARRDNDNKQFALNVMHWLSGLL
jgi:hypothetical protein